MKRTHSKEYVDQNGYKRGELPEHSDLIHRQIAYCHIYLKNQEKYPLPFSKYVVHHIDHNKQNNDVSNLQLLLQEDHEKIHGRSNGKLIGSKTHLNKPEEYIELKTSLTSGLYEEPPPIFSPDFKIKLFVLGLMVLLIVGVLLLRQTPQQFTIKSETKSPDTYEEMYSMLYVDMGGKDFRSLAFNKGFELPIGELSEIKIYRFPMDEKVIVVYFDAIAQVEEKSNYWVFTDAKIIHIEMYHKGMKIAEK